MVSAFAQAPAANPGASPSRAEVKAGASAANADKVNEFEDRPGAKASTKSRAEVKAERDPGAQQLRANTEVQTPGTSSQQNLQNPKALTAEEKAQRRADRKAKREARRAKNSTAAAGTTGTNATRPANGGAGTEPGGASMK